MQNLIHFLSVQNTFFTLWDYPMSYLEFFGTLLNILSVWLVAKKNILTWPIGIVAVVLFGVLFYQIQLYSDLIEQIYYVITGFYGWWLWKKYKEEENKEDNLFSYDSKINNSISLSIVFIGTILMGYFISRIHLYFPRLFVEPASFPYLDAFTTVMSFVAQILMARKKIECWYLWIAVDIIGIGLYWVKGVKFVALLYLIFLVLATKGLLNWKKEAQNNKGIKIINNN